MIKKSYTSLKDATNSLQTKTGSMNQCKTTSQNINEQKYSILKAHYF
jgi:hypothetical protein